MGNSGGFARKEVRQFAKWLTREGWVRDSDDNAGHARFVWPATGFTLSLPSTPRGDRWRQILRSQACRVMGKPAHDSRPNHRHAHKPPVTSGFSLAAAIKDQNRSQGQPASDVIDELWTDRDGLIDVLADLGKHPTYRAADDGKKALERIRAIEADLRAYGCKFTPFDITDITDRS